MCISVNLHIVCHLAENYHIKPFVTIKYACIKSYVIFCDIKQNYFSLSSNTKPNSSSRYLHSPPTLYQSCPAADDCWCPRFSLTAHTVPCTCFIIIIIVIMTITKGSRSHIERLVKWYLSGFKTVDQRFYPNMTTLHSDICYRKSVCRL